jgi:hypothetical protein
MLLRGGFLERGRWASVFLVSAVERRQDAFSQHFGLGLNPVFEGTAFGLATLVITMLRVQANLPFEQFGHQCLLLLSTGIVVHSYSLGLNRCFRDSFYDTGTLLTECYIVRTW